MADNEEVFPVTGQPMDQAPWERLVNALATTGIVGNPGGPELQAYRTAGGLFVRPGLGFVRGHGFYRPASDGDRQLTVAQNSGGSTRLDLVTLRLNPLNSPLIDILVITGGASAPVPTRTETGILDVPLAIAAVPSGSNVPSTVTDAREFSGADVIPCRAVADIPAERRRIGTIGVESTSGNARYWTGTSWLTLALSTHTHPEVFSPTRQWNWGGIPYIWGVPNGNWNEAPGAKATFDVIEGHVYEYESVFTIVSVATGKADWRASHWVAGGLTREISGHTGADQYGAPSLHPTLVTKWRAWFSGPCAFTTFFAVALGGQQQVFTKYYTPWSTVTDLGPRPA